MKYKQLLALNKAIPNTEIRQKIGAFGLWEYALYCKITGLELKQWLN